MSWLSKNKAESSGLPTGLRIELNYYNTTQLHIILSLFCFVAAGICYDYVEVHDGPSTKNRSLGKYCGHLRPFAILSTSSVLLIRFYSDQSLQKEGFQLVYQAKRKWWQDIGVSRPFLGVVRSRFVARQREKALQHCTDDEATFETTASSRHILLIPLRIDDSSDTL